MTEKQSICTGSSICSAYSMHSTCVQDVGHRVGHKHCSLSCPCCLSVILLQKNSCQKRGVRLHTAKPLVTCPLPRTRSSHSICAFHNVRSDLGQMEVPYIACPDIFFFFFFFYWFNLPEQLRLGTSVWLMAVCCFFSLNLALHQRVVKEKPPVTFCLVVFPLNCHLVGFKRKILIFCLLHMYTI